MKTILKFNQKKLFLSISILILGLFAFLLFLFLNQTYSFYIPCFFHKITGLYCPGCGITRMVLSLLHLDFYQAFRWNPFLFLLTPLFIVYGGAYFLYWLYDREAPKGKCTIDRINNDGNYEPSNCRWISMQEQNKNKRKPQRKSREYNIFNEELNCKQIEKKYGISQQLFKYRIKKGMSYEEAVTTEKKRGIDFTKRH